MRPSNKPRDHDHATPSVSLQLLELSSAEALREPARVELCPIDQSSRVLSRRLHDSSRPPEVIAPWYGKPARRYAFSLLLHTLRQPLPASRISGRTTRFVRNTTCDFFSSTRSLEIIPDQGSPKALGRCTPLVRVETCMGRAQHQDDDLLGPTGSP